MWYIEENDKGGYTVFGDTPLKTRDDLNKHREWLRSLNLNADTKELLRKRAELFYMMSNGKKYGISNYVKDEDGTFSKGDSMLGDQK